MIALVLALALTAYDGDTLKENGKCLRLERIDAPEIFDKARCPFEHAHGIKARNFVQRRLDLPGVQIHLIRSGRRDKYKRPLVRLIVNRQDVGEELVAAGLAKRWPPRAEWCN